MAAVRHSSPPSDPKRLCRAGTRLLLHRPLLARTPRPPDPDGRLNSGSASVPVSPAASALRACPAVDLVIFSASLAGNVSSSSWSNRRLSLRLSSSSSSLVLFDIYHSPCRPCWGFMSDGNGHRAAAYVNGREVPRLSSGERI